MQLWAWWSGSPVLLLPPFIPLQFVHGVVSSGMFSQRSNLVLQTKLLQLFQGFWGSGVQCSASGQFKQILIAAALVFVLSCGCAWSHKAELPEEQHRHTEEQGVNSLSLFLLVNSLSLTIPESVSPGTQSSSDVSVWRLQQGEKLSAAFRVPVLKAAHSSSDPGWVDAVMCLPATDLTFL